MNNTLGGRRGFTIIELLVVIVVISILASITVVAFGGVQQRAKSSAYITALQSWEKILRIQNVQDGEWYNTNGYLVCLGTGFEAADGFAASQCVRSVPANVISAGELPAFNTAIETVVNPTPKGLLPMIKTVDPAHSNREGYVRGLAYAYNSANSSAPAYIEYYIDKGTGLTGCIGSDTLEYGAYLDGAKRCRRYMK